MGSDDVQYFEFYGVGRGGGVGRGRGVGVGLCVEVSFSLTATTNCDWLGIPLAKTVTSACPMGKPLELVVIRVIGVEVKEVLDHPVIASTGRKSVCSLARLSSWTSG